MSPNNFLEDSDEKSNIAEINFLAFNSFLTNSNDNETPSDTLFGLSTHSSINYHSDQLNPHFGSDYDAIRRSPKQKPFKISKFSNSIHSLTLLFSQAFNKRK